MCRNWELTKTCQFGNACNYAHGKTQLKPREQKNLSPKYVESAAARETKVPSYRNQKISPAKESPHLKECENQRRKRSYFETTKI